MTRASGFLLHILMCFFVLHVVSGRYYDGETGFLVDILDAHNTRVTVSSRTPFQAIYFSMNGSNGRTFHYLMYHNASVFLQLQDSPNVLTGPVKAINDPNLYLGIIFTYPLGQYYKSVMGENTTLWGLKGYDLFNPWNVTIGFINDTFSIPFVSKPLFFTRKLNFIDSAVITPILSKFRAEDYHPAYFACMLAFYLISFVSCIIFSRNQPLKSRGLAPYIACILQFLLLLPDLLSFLPRSVHDISITQELYYDYVYWIVHNYFRYAGILMFMLLSVSMAIRFVILLNVNARKQLFIKDKNTEVGDVKITWKIIKLLGNPWITPFLVIFWYFVFASYLSLGWINRDTRSHFWFLAGVVAILVLAVLTFIGDILTNLRRIRKCQWKWLWVEDVFYFRIELYVISIVIILPYFVLFYLILSDDNFPEIYLVNETHNGLLYAINSISFWLFYFLQVGFVLTLTIMQFLRQKCSNRNKKEDEKGFLKELLANKESHHIFENYCKHEFSMENISCYDEIQEYKQIKDDRSPIANRILRLYLSGSASELEVNVSGTNLTNIASCVQNQNQSGSQSTWPDDIFMDVELELLGNMRDVYVRFRTTATWKQFVKAKNFMDEIYGKVTVVVKE